MQVRHVPSINPRYWTGITLASIFGTNMGDFYAHESGLGLLGGLPILIALFAAVFVAERFDKLRHEAYYWLCIIIMRTGATNIADFMAGKRGWHIDRGVLSLGLGLLLAALAVWAHVRDHMANGPSARKTVPDTDPIYWCAMLTAGVFGTVFGDFFEKSIGEGVSAIGLSVVLALALLVYSKGWLKVVLAYWMTVGIARTTGTAIGDYFADSKDLNIGLTYCTLISGACFVAVLLLWRTPKQADPALAV